MSSGFGSGLADISPSSPKIGIADAAIQLQRGADDVMMVAVGFYCGNSVAEKGIIGYFKARAKDSTESSAANSEEDNNIGENG